VDAAQPINDAPIWAVMDGRAGMDRTRPPGERWHLATSPWFKKILDAWQDPQVQEIVVRAGSQTWKTTLFLLALAWSVKHRPVPKLWLTAKDDLAKDISQDRIQPTLERSPDLADLLLDNRLDKTTYKIRTKLCTIDIAGAESSTALEQNPYGEILSDECRNYPAGYLQKLRMRQRNYRDAKRALFSTPSLVGDEFDQRFNIGSQEEWMFPCMKCGDMIPLVWSSKYSRLPEPWNKKSEIKWDKETGVVWLECHCHHRHMDAPDVRGWILNRGDWVSTFTEREQTKRDPTVVSFHYPAMLNPMVVWWDCVKGFYTALSLKDAGNVEDLKLFVNETLGEPWREGQHIEDSEVVKATYRIEHLSGVTGKDWKFVFHTNDVGKRDFWHIVRGWNPGAQTRILSAGQLRYWQDIKDIAKRFGLVMTGRGDEGLAEGQCRRVFLDVRYEDPVEQEVHRACAEQGWTGLVGIPKPYFEEVYEENDEKKKQRLLYSDPRYFDSKTGLAGTAEIRGVEFSYAEGTAQDILDELLAGRVGKFEHPLDCEFELTADHRIAFTADTYAIHMRNEPKLPEVNKRTGHVEYKRKRQGPQHLRDCEKMQVVAASMVDLIGIPAAVEAKEDDNGEKQSA
jgi:hypothetical protein